MNKSRELATRTVSLANLSPNKLRAALDAAHVHLNAHAQQLLHFLPWPNPQDLAGTMVFVTVSDLRLTGPATLSAIYAQAQQRGWQPCPLSWAVALRLSWLDQPSSSNQQLHRHRAPQGAVTVASPITDFNGVGPKGFYLRRIGSTCWLRGYVCDDLYEWPATSWFAFRQTAP